MRLRGRNRSRCQGLAIIVGQWFTMVTFAALLFTSGFCAAFEPETVPMMESKAKVQGSLVIIGGAARVENTELWNEIARLAAKRGQRKKIAVFPCASRYPLKNGDRTISVLNTAGADAFLVPVAPSGIDVDYKSAVHDPELVASVRDADGVFFIGGAQSRICETLLTPAGDNTPMLDAVWDVYRKGGVIAGTSAGAAIMSRVMFRDASVVLATLANGVKMGHEIDRGLGFLDSSWFVDQHFMVRGRFARSLVAMHSQNLQFGVGVDEDSALVVEQGADARVVGQRGVIVMDISKSRSDESLPGFNLKNVKLTYLNRGDRLNLKTLAVTPIAAKLNDRKIDPFAPTFKPVVGRRLFMSDILANTAVVDMMQKLIEHKENHAIGLAYDGAAANQGSTGGFEFRFYRDKDSRAWETDDFGGSDFTIQNIHLDIRPIKVRGPVYEASPTETVNIELPNGIELANGK